MTEPVRVLVIHSAYRSGPASGENRVVEDEIHLLRDGGHEVIPYVVSAPVESPIQMLSTGVGATWSTAAAGTITRLIRTHRPHVVHAHNLFPSLSPAAIHTARRAGVPVVVTLHNYRMLCLPGTLLRDGKPCEDCLGRVPWRGVVHSCFRGSFAASAALATSIGVHRGLGTFADVTLYSAVSRFVRDKHVAAGWPASQFVVKPNFSWASERRRGPGEYFLYLGRLSQEKGVETLLSAMARVDARCIVAGDGPMRAQLQEDAPPNIEFLGTVDPGRAAELIRKARAVVLPSRSYEAGPRSIVEAYAAGVPVIASRLGALPEFISHGTTGLLFSPGDSADLSEASHTLLDDHVSERMGEHAHVDWLQKYTPERGLQALERVYGQALKRHAAG